MKLFRKNHASDKEEEDDLNNDLTMTEFDDDDGTVPPPPPSSPPPISPSPSVSHYTSDGMDHVSIVSSVKGQDQFSDNARPGGMGEDAPFVSNNVGYDDMNGVNGANGPNGYSEVPFRGHFRGMMNAQSHDEQDAGMDEIEVPSSSVVDRWNQWEEKYALRKRCRMYGIGIVGCVLVILAVVLGSVFGTMDRGGERNAPVNGDGVDGQEGDGTGNGNGGDAGVGGENGNVGDGDKVPATGAPSGNNYVGPVFLHSAAGQAIWTSPLLPESTTEDLENENVDSAAYKAFQWIASDTNNAYAFETMGGEEAELDLMQRFALASLYNSAELVGFEGWMTGDDVCTWEGIVCDGDEASKVTTLKFPNNDIVGTLPSELVFLQDLEVIEMFGNKISGEIPDEIYSLPQLEIIDLQNNMISGPISPAIGNANGLVGLYLGRNMISGKFPLELFNLESLVALWLDYNEELEGQSLPEEIGQLQNLEELKLAETQLVGNLPEAIGSLEKLRIFHAQENGIQGEIPDLMNLKDLVELDLTNNWFEGNLPVLRGFTELVRLRLGGNILSGNIPNHYGELESIIDLSLGPNFFEGYYDSGLEGEVPASLGALENIEILELSGNNLSGEIPEEVCELYDARLEEEIPVTIKVSADCDVDCDCCEDDCERD